jgi:hypothetical protein
MSEYYNLITTLYVESFKELPFQVDQKMGSRPDASFSSFILHPSSFFVERRYAMMKRGESSGDRYPRIAVPVLNCGMERYG